MASAPASDAPEITLLNVGYNHTQQDLVFHANAVAAGAVCLGFVLFWLVIGAKARRWWKASDIDEAEIGIGAGKVKIRPNNIDRQVAYQIWVELSTRKIGLSIDPDHDVIAEVYDSWHTFFSVTRDLIKSVPVTRVSDTSTKRIINLSIEVLNEGLRPHLTQWQARFRNWYERELAAASAAADEPQEIQKRFPAFAALEKDLRVVNKRLMAYRASMYRLVHGG